MVKAVGQHSPRTYLDKSVVRIALERARALVGAGLSPRDAARAATPGAWAEFEGDVLSALLAREV